MNTHFQRFQQGLYSITVLAVMLLSLLLAGCGTLPAGSGGTSQTEFAYVANEGSDTVSQYTIGANGALTPMTPATVATGNVPGFVTVAPGGRFAYVANESTILQYTIGANGALAPATFTAATGPQSVTVAQGGRFAYVANAYANTGTILQYTIGANGALTPMTPATVATGNSPAYLAVAPGGRFAYVVNSGSDTVSQYTIGANGALTPMTPATVATGDVPSSVAVTPDGRFAYVANSGNNHSGSDTVSQYTIGANGALTPMTPATVATGNDPLSVAVTPDGRFAYVANTGHNPSGSDTVSQYTIGANGALTPMTPATIATGNGPISVVTTATAQ